MPLSGGYLKRNQLVRLYSYATEFRSIWQGRLALSLGDFTRLPSLTRLLLIVSGLRFVTRPMVAFATPVQATALRYQVGNAFCLSKQSETQDVNRNSGYMWFRHLPPCQTLATSMPATRFVLPNLRRSALSKFVLPQTRCEITE